MTDLRSFLTALFAALSRHGIAACVLRNHDGLPDTNPANDIDILVSSFDVRLLPEIAHDCGVDLTDFIERSYVTHAFFHGVAWGDKRAIQIDFIFALAWKGVPYLDHLSVLEAARPPTPRDPWLRVPAAADEAIISLFSTFLMGGAIKERYQAQVVETFRREGDAMRGRLDRVVPDGLMARFIRLVQTDDRKALLMLPNRLRVTLLRRALRRDPAGTARRLLAYARAEIAIRTARDRFMAVAVVGTGDPAGLVERLRDVTKTIRLESAADAAAVRRRLRRGSNFREVLVWADYPSDAPVPAVRTTAAAGETAVVAALRDRAAARLVNRS